MHDRANKIIRIHVKVYPMPNKEYSSQFVPVNQTGMNMFTLVLQSV